MDERQDFSTVAKDIAFLYELSLAVGQSLDLKENCDRFLKMLMARKNLSYVSLWVQKKHLLALKETEQVDPGCDSAVLIYANPRFRVNEEMLPLDHCIFSMLDGKEAFSLSYSDEGFSEIVTEKGITKGSFAIFKMEDLGFMKLYSMVRETRFTEKELNQLRNVISKFSVSIRGCIAYKKMIKEIEERKRVEKALRESEHFLNTVVENIPDMIFVKEAEDLRFVRFNRAGEKLLGYPRVELVGKNDYDFFPQNQADSFTNKDRRVLSTGVIHDIPEGEIHTRYRGKRILHTKKIPIFSDNGKPLYLLGISEDVTERKKAEEALRKAKADLEIRVEERTRELSKANEELLVEIKERERSERELERAKKAAESASNAKSEFLANMSHELRTPLNHIIGFTELVVDKRFGDLNETQEDYLKDALQSGKHLLSLINDILDLSKVEAGKLKIARTSFNPRMVLESGIRMVREEGVKHGIELSMDTDGIPESIWADERTLKQIIYNLLSNAVKFTPDGGKVHLSARLVGCIVRRGRRKGDPEDLEIIENRIGRSEAVGDKHKKCIEISVCDTGIGIKPEDQERIFERFEQGDGSSSRSYRGTGLGLSLTKRLVELNGGKLWVRSDGQGRGSTFSFVIPISERGPCF